MGVIPEAVPESSDGPRYVLVRAAGQRVLLPLEDVRELVTVRAPTRLPGAPAWVAGLYNLRGTVLTVADLGLRLQGAAASGPVVVVEVEERRLGIRVDAVERVDRALGAEAAVEPARSAGGLMRGLATLSDGTAPVLDVTAMRRTALAEA